MIFNSNVCPSPHRTHQQMSAAPSKEIQNPTTFLTPAASTLVPATTVPATTTAIAPTASRLPQSTVHTELPISPRTEPTILSYPGCKTLRGLSPGSLADLMPTHPSPPASLLPSKHPRYLSPRGSTVPYGWNAPASDTSPFLSTQMTPI